MAAIDQSICDRRFHKEAEIYKRAGVSKQMHSRIVHSATEKTNYRPLKETAIAYAVVLGLNSDEIEVLLRTLDESDVEFVVCTCLDLGIRNVDEINDALDYCGLPTLGTQLRRQKSLANDRDE